jgi:hypothetical protein
MTFLAIHTLHTDVAPVSDMARQPSLQEMKTVPFGPGTFLM